MIDEDNTMLIIISALIPPSFATRSRTSSAHARLHSAFAQHMKLICVDTVAEEKENIHML